MIFLSQYAADAFPVPDLVEAYDRQAKGIPIGRAAEINLRNNHAQYIFTWLVKTLVPQTNRALSPVALQSERVLTLCRYGLSLATSIMLWMLVRKKPNEAMRRVRQNRNW